MFSWTEIVQKYVIGHSDRIKEATRPLLTRFGIEYFTFHRIDQEGRYTVLVNRPDWAETYVSSKFFEYDPYLRDPAVYRSGMCLFHHHGSEHYKNTVVETAKSTFHWDSTVLCIEKGAEAVEFFGFATNQARGSLEQLYLNQRGVLREFARHFKRELSLVLQEMREIEISLPAIKGKDFYCKQPIGPRAREKNLLAFLSDLGLKNELAQMDSLTPSEKRCLRALLQGCSAKETAASLHLSPRTVESHLETLKSKLDCSNKRELFLLAKKCVELDILNE